MSNRKSNIVLLGVVALAFVSAGFYWLAVGPQLVGILLLIIGVLSLVWVWRSWRQATSA